MVLIIKITFYIFAEHFLGLQLGIFEDQVYFLNIVVAFSILPILSRSRPTFQRSRSTPFKILVALFGISVGVFKVVVSLFEIKRNFSISFH